MTVLVTGGSKGLGRAISVRLAAPEDDVFIVYHLDDEAAESTAAAVRAKGSIAHLIKADVGTFDGIQHVFSSVGRVAGSLHQIVHAAVYALPTTLLDVSRSDFTRALDVNALAFLYLTQAARPLLVEGSSLFFVTSAGSQRVIANYGAVGATKALGESLVRYLAAELAPQGVRVNAIQAGPVDTAAFRAMFGDKAERRISAAFSKLGDRVLTPGDVADVVAFLASPAGAHIQGQVSVVDGGTSLF